MKLGSRFIRGLLAVVVLAITANADVIVSQTGTFTNGDDKQLFSFTLPTTSDVTLQTLSFAGGTNAKGQPIAEGGFAPDLTLFDSTTGNWLAADQGGTSPSACGSRATDSATGYCLDAYIEMTLGPGSYLLVLTQDPNIALGDYPDGFSADLFLLFDPSNPFYLNADSGYQRTGDWAVDITTPSMSPVPEPSSLTLLLSALAVGCIAVAVQKPRF